MLYDDSAFQYSGTKRKLNNYNYFPVKHLVTESFKVNNKEQSKDIQELGHTAKNAEKNISLRVCLLAPPPPPTRHWGDKKR